MTQPPARTAARARYRVTIGLGLIAVTGAVLLAAADAIRGSVHWAHHSPASAAPLFLIAATIAAVSIGRQPKRRHALLRLVAVLAFTAWGTAQLLAGPAAGALNDTAIVLFVIDAACAAGTEGRASQARHRQPAEPNLPQRDPAEPAQQAASLREIGCACGS